MQIRNVYGIDLGTSTVKIYDLKKDTITKEKNMIAIRNREQVIAVGNYAYEMHERTPSNYPHEQRTHCECIDGRSRFAHASPPLYAPHGIPPGAVFFSSLRYDRD